MTRSLLAMMAAAAVGILLVIPDDVSARTGAARGSAAGVHRAGTRAVVRKSVHHRRPGVRNRMAVGHRSYFWDSGYGYGGGMDGGAGGALGSGCYVERRQINDFDGWRVRDVTVCPGGQGPR